MLPLFFLCLLSFTILAEEISVRGFGDGKDGKSVDLKLLSGVPIATTTTTTTTTTTNGHNSPIQGLLQRRLGKSRASSFTTTIKPNDNNEQYFTILKSSDPDPITIQGSDFIAIGRGIREYLESHVNISFSWKATGGDNTILALPSNVSLPTVMKSITKISSSTYRYYFNTCTYGYSMFSWDWSRWESEIDWMVLQGINYPLSMLGAEYIWKKTFMENFQLTRNDLNNFFSGPAFLPWHWMGNLDGWGGPLTDQWMERGRQMQHKYLCRIRSFGMIPVLPSFAGFVPEALLKLFPNAISRDSSGWGGFSPTHTLDPLDPLFVQVGSAFVKNYCLEYGCSSDTKPTFTADLYNELLPPKTDLDYISNVSKSVQQTIQAGYDAYIQTNNSTNSSTTTTNITWVTQGWMFYSRATFWTPSRIKAFVTGPPIDSLVLLDLYAEVSPIWNSTGGGFFNTNWVFSTIFNFGGRSGLYGRLNQLKNGVNQALLANATKGNGMIGIGAAPEAIETDPIMYDLLFSLAWKEKTEEIESLLPAAATTTTDLTEWVKSWATRRYHIYNTTVDERLIDAWVTMYKEGPYGCTRPQQGPTGSLIVARPELFQIKQVSCCDQTDPYYPSAVLSNVWKTMLDVGGKKNSLIQNQPTFLHDVADIGTQVLSNLVYKLHEEIAVAYNASNSTLFHELSVKFLNVINDTDILASTQDQRLLGQWIAQARATATTTISTAAASSFPPKTRATATTTISTAAATSFPPKTCSSDPFDCGFPGINQTTCEKQGCCYHQQSKVPSSSSSSLSSLSSLACTFGQLKNDADVMEWNARQQITLWANEKLGLHEYSYRLWGGLIKSFYYERWRMFFEQVEASMARGETSFSKTKFWNEIEIWEQKWCRETNGNFSIVPETNVLEKATVVYNKYF